MLDFRRIRSLNMVLALLGWATTCVFFTTSATAAAQPLSSTADEALNSNSDSDTGPDRADADDFGHESQNGRGVGRATAGGGADFEPDPRRGYDTMSAWNRAGRGLWPRFTYQAPPFDGEDFWLPGGVFRTRDPQLFLMPVRAGFLWDLSGDIGYYTAARVWGNSIISGGLDIFALMKPNDYGDHWRLSTDISFQMWLGTKASLELGLLFGIERDVLRTTPAVNDIGILLGATARLTLARLELRADYMGRLDTKHALGFGDLRHAVHLAANLELLRIDILSLDAGFWFHAVQGGRPRIGLQFGLRIWFAAGREAPDFAHRYGTLGH